MTNERRAGTGDGETRWLWWMMMMMMKITSRNKSACDDGLLCRRTMTWIARREPVQRQTATFAERDLVFLGGAPKRQNALAISEHEWRVIRGRRSRSRRMRIGGERRSRG